VDEGTRRWNLGHPWSLVVEENDAGWRLSEGAGDAEGLRPQRLVDRTGAFGAPAEEVRLAGRSGTWTLRVFPERRVLAAGPVPGGRLDLPQGWWWEDEPDARPWPIGIGADGTGLEDLESCERRGWQRWLPGKEAPDGPDSDGAFMLVAGWHAHDPRHGDTAILRRSAPREGEALLRSRFGRTDVGVALDCRGILDPEDTEDQIADAFLFLHQCLGARWLALEAPPSTRVERALERAHMDAQGEVFAVWIAAGFPAGRSSWKRLGPCLRRREMDPDCYVWGR